MHSRAMLAVILSVAPTLAISTQTAIRVEEPWARIQPAGQDIVVVCVTLVSAAGDRLTHVSSPVATQATIYQTYRKGGKASLHKLDGDLTLAPNQPVHMTMGGTQIFLSGLKRGLVAGDTLALTLRFAHAGNVDVTIPIKPSTATGPEP